MKGAIIVSTHGGFADQVAIALRNSGMSISRSGELIQIADNQGRLFTVGEPYSDSTSDPDLEALQDTRPKGFDVTYLVDCRWEDLFCQIVRRVAQETGFEFRIIDNADRVIHPQEIEEENLSL